VDLSIFHDTSQKKKPFMHASLSFSYVCCANRSGSLHVARSCPWRRISFFPASGDLYVSSYDGSLYSIAARGMQHCSAAANGNGAAQLDRSSPASTAAVLDNDVAESVMQRCLIASVQNLGSNWQVSGGEVRTAVNGTTGFIRGI
jgi:hypothetical protein